MRLAPFAESPSEGGAVVGSYDGRGVASWSRVLRGLSGED